MLLGERLRNDEEKAVVCSVLENRFGVQIDTGELYGSPSDLSAVIEQAKRAGGTLRGIAANRSLARLLKLVRRCVEHREPVLLIGETGCGKTTVCQLLSVILERELRMVNCHQSTEAADILGSLRPVRGRSALVKKLSELSKDFLATCNSLIGADRPDVDDLEVSQDLIFDFSACMMVSPLRQCGCGGQSTRAI